MANITQIVTDWSVPGARPGATVMHFLGSDDVPALRGVVGGLWNSTRTLLNSVVTYRVRTDGKILDEDTGILTSTWADATAVSGNGSSAEQTVPDLAQMLYRWRTGTVRNGRVVQGRSFIPGIAVSRLEAGKLSAASRGVAVTAVSNFIGLAPGFGVYCRPTPARELNPGVITPAQPGQFAPIEGAGVWDEIASLRRRRT
uniref:Uncharacterized protein n=1 Tax=uncultured prokaryote TaxID=198431 RepID=A0A0H5Q7B4_9ZZZZ|nr:hypothetical protein [uncultured prokaryote]